MLDGYDKLVENNAVPHVYVDQLAIDEALKLDGPQRVQAFRALLRPMWGNGRTLRDLADLTQLDLRAVTAYMMAGLPDGYAVGYANAEEDMIDNGFDTYRALAKKWNVSEHRISAIAKRHGIKPRSVGSGMPIPHHIRERGVELLRSGMSSTKVRDQLRDEFPEHERLAKVTPRAIRAWRKTADTLEVKRAA